MVDHSDNVSHLNREQGGCIAGWPQQSSEQCARLVPPNRESHYLPISANHPPRLEFISNLQQTCTKFDQLFEFLRTFCGQKSFTSFSLKMKSHTKKPRVYAHTHVYEQIRDGGGKFASLPSLIELNSRDHGTIFSCLSPTLIC